MRARGFTLIELMIAVAIVAILASIAYPSYVTQVQKSRRADGKAALLAVAGKMERYFTERSTYATATLGSASTNVYPAISESGNYNLTFATPRTASAYTVRAAPAGVQATDPCGTLTYTSQGVKGVTGSLTVSQCW
jgi:type IV pilus assembly protein PilE